MAINSTALTAMLDNLRKKPVWRLVGADLAPLWIGMLQTHLYTKDRVLPSSIFHERVGLDLEHLRAAGWDLDGDARYYIAMWVREGWVERRLPASATEEEYELSTAAIDGMRFSAGIEKPHASATESRLSLVMQALQGLADETDVDRAHRIERLREEQHRIQQEIEAIERGKMRVLSHDAAVERAREVIGLAAGIAEDFRRVRESFDVLNREMRVQIMESEGSRADVLQAMFDGIDVIAESDAGRSFNAFWRLLTAPEQSTDMEAAIAEITSRDFFATIDPQERKFLLGFTRSLLVQSGDVQNVMRDIARGLKSFVQTQEYTRQRHLNQVLKETQKVAFEVRKHIRPYDKVSFDLMLTSAKVNSVSQYVLKDPSLRTKAGAMEEGEPAEISLDSINDLVQFADIDFRTLEENIDACLAELEQASIGEILRRFPATQGLGSVIGLISIGSKRGFEVPLPAAESVQWTGMDDVQRGARIPLIFFAREDSHAA